MEVVQSAADLHYGTLNEGVGFAAGTMGTAPIYLGVQFDGRWVFPNGGVLVPYIRLSWMHDFSPQMNVTRYFTALPGLSFSGNGIPTVSNAAVAHVGVQYKLGVNLTLLRVVDTEVGTDDRSVAATANLRCAW